MVGKRRGGAGCGGRRACAGAPARGGVYRVGEARGRGLWHLRRHKMWGTVLRMLRVGVMPLGAACCVLIVYSRGEGCSAGQSLGAVGTVGPLALRPPPAAGRAAAASKETLIRSNSRPIGHHRRAAPLPAAAAGPACSVRQRQRQRPDRILVKAQKGQSCQQCGLS